MADAEVTLRDGLPCFGVPAKESERNGVPEVAALIVYRLSSEGFRQIWSFHTGDDASPLLLHAGSCFLYGRAPVGTEMTDPEPLQSDRIYSVYLNGRPADADDPTQGYRARFCLLDKESGGPQLVLLTQLSADLHRNTCPSKGH